jgi:LacI family transcriptional regulator
VADAPASIREVAAYAGVSVGTVSNVLNRPDIVAEPTRSRVRAAIEQLGFIRNESARQLRAGRSRTIGLVVLDVANPSSRAKRRSRRSGGPQGDRHPAARPAVADRAG